MPGGPGATGQGFSQPPYQPPQAPPFQQPPMPPPGFQPPVFPPPAAGLTPVTIIIRVIKVIGVIGGVLVVAVIIAAALVFTGDPAPCVDRVSASSPAAAIAAQAKWDAFKAARGGATVSFNEQEVTTRGLAYVDERDLPVRNLQVYFCPDGKAEAKGQIRVLGRNANVLVRGSLDVRGGENVIVVDSVKAGNLPSFIATRAVDTIIDRNDARHLPLGVTLTAANIGDGSITLLR